MKLLLEVIIFNYNDKIQKLEHKIISWHLNEIHQKVEKIRLR